jgi:two-component system response regulator NreC
MGKRHRICIAEDHTILRDGLRALLASQPDIEVAGEAADGLALIDRLQRAAVELVILDLSMPRLHGLQAIGEIKKRWPTVKVLVLTMHAAEEYVMAALRAGADGYLLKDSSRTELMLAIHALLCGKTYLSPTVSGRVVRACLAGGAEIDAPGSTREGLTAREQQVLKLIAEGYRNKNIAALLHISVKTVESHRTRLMKKLDLHNVSALTGYAIAQGLVTNG